MPPEYPSIDSYALMVRGRMSFQAELRPAPSYATEGPLMWWGTDSPCPAMHLKPRANATL